MRVLGLYFGWLYRKKRVLQLKNYVSTVVKSDLTSAKTWLIFANETVICHKAQPSFLLVTFDSLFHL